MKTGEIYTHALTNPVAKLLRKRNNRKYHFGINGALYDELGEHAVEIRANEDWELIREKVDFMTALNSGKPIKGAGCSDFHPYGWYFKVGLSIEQINGLWEIE